MENKTLSELIEMCGEHLHYLRRTNDIDGKLLWYAQDCVKKENGELADAQEQNMGYGITPEEAVKDLLLILNKNGNTN